MVTNMVPNVTPDQVYTLSFYYHASGSIIGQSSYIQQSDGTWVTMNMQIQNDSNWHRHIMQWTCPIGITSITLRFGFQCTAPAWMVLDCAKLEQGNKATDWSPAPEDTQSQITIINSNYSNLNQTLNSISSTVGSLQTTTSSLGTRMTSTESSVSQLNNSITSKVTQADINNSINGIQVGGTNYILNGHANLGVANWSADVVDYDNTREYVFCKYNSSTNENYLQCTPVKVLPSTTYTVQAVIGIDNNVTNIDLWVLGSKSHTDGTYDYNHGNFASMATPAVYTNYVGTFTTASDENYVYVRIDNNGSKTSGTIAKLWATAIKLEQGNKATDWTPAPEDFQNQINSATATITQLSSQINLRVTTDTYNSGMSTANSNAQNYANSAIISANNHTDSQISILSGQISSKVDVNGVISTIQQNASAVQIAFNAINSAGVKIDTLGLSVESGYFKITKGGVTAFSVEDDGVGNVGLELGTATVRNRPYLDFHSSGYANDNDARIICDGGMNYNSDGNSGSGHLGFYALGGFTFNTSIMANGHRLVETESTGLECITYLAVIGNTHIACNTSSYNWGITIYASDRSLKRNIANTDIVALDKIMSIQHRQFDWIEDIAKPHTSIGYISQELMEIDPQFAFEVPQGLTDEGVQKTSLYQPDVSIILPTITKAIQELQLEIIDLKLQITELQNKVS